MVKCWSEYEQSAEEKIYILVEYCCAYFSLLFKSYNNLASAILLLIKWRSIFYNRKYKVKCD